MRSRLFIRRHIDVLAIGLLLLTFGVAQTGRDVFVRKQEIVQRLRVERTKVLDHLRPFGSSRGRHIRPVRGIGTVSKWLRIA
jgi:hypothetical protein